MSWPPHITVACVVEDQGRFLMVEETSNQRQVFNQPAGHLEPAETLIEAAVRETLEETGWLVEINALLGFYIYSSPHNGVCYHRWCFVATPVRHDPEQPLDQGIIGAPWMSEAELRRRQHQLRSPMVLQAIDDYRSGKRYPLDLIPQVPPAS
jgi:8-oxo-dGTP pyrophosphatase MutT (NUDIX family)